MGEAARVMEPEEPTRIAPQPGPQMAFAQCEADICIFGGGAGGGKSIGLLYEAAKWSHVPGYRAVLFRRTSPELFGGGGLWDESQEMYRAFGGRARAGNTLDWRFESGARIEFRHLQREADRFAHQGRQYALVGFDELTHFTESQFWYLFGRLRSTCGVRPYLRATCNPDPDSFVAKLIEWWIGEDGFPLEERSGVLRWFVRVDDDLHWYDTEAEARLAHPGEQVSSLTFIPSRITDNPALLEKDPDAIGKLQAQNRVDRARLLDGNWKIRASAGLVFNRDHFMRAHKPPSRVVRTVRCWDKGAVAPHEKNTDPDWTRGVRVSLCEDGELWIDDLVSVRAGPAEVFELMRETAERDGVEVVVGLWKDRGGAGVVDVKTTEAILSGFAVEVVDAAEGVIRGHGGRGRAKWAHAKVWAPRVEKGEVYVLISSWMNELLAECDGFPDARHDDIVDAISLAVQLLLHEQGTSLVEAMKKVRIGWR